MSRRVHGRLRKLTLADRVKKAARNQRRERPIFARVERQDRKGNTVVLRVPRNEYR
jgi:hypothetical protein